MSLGKASHFIRILYTNCVDSGGCQRPCLWYCTIRHVRRWKQIRAYRQSHVAIFVRIACLGGSGSEGKEVGVTLRRRVSTFSPSTENCPAADQIWRTSSSQPFVQLETQLQPHGSYVSHCIPTRPAVLFTNISKRQADQSLALKLNIQSASGR